LQPWYTNAGAWAAFSAEGTSQFIVPVTAAYKSYVIGFSSWRMTAVSIASSFIMIFFMTFWAVDEQFCNRNATQK